MAKEAYQGGVQLWELVIKVGYIPFYIGAHSLQVGGGKALGAKHIHLQPNIYLIYQEFTNTSPFRFHTIFSSNQHGVKLDVLPILLILCFEKTIFFYEDWVYNVSWDISINCF